MNQPLLLALLLSVVLGPAARAHEIFFSFNQEFQSFYLSPPNSSQYFGRSELLTKGQLDFFENLKFKLGTSTSQTFMEKQDQKSFLFNPTQLGLGFSGRYFEFFGGGFTVAGEGADVNNIFDVVNAQDYRNPFNSKSIGAVGTLLTVPFNSFVFKAFFIPKNEKSRLPDTQSSWFPRTDSLPVRGSDSTLIIPANMSYKLVNESEFKKPFENNYGASAKVSFSHVDFNFFYYKGVNQTPKLTPHINGQIISITPAIARLIPPVEITYNWFTSEHVGMGSTIVLGDWIGKVFCKNQTDNLAVNETSSACTGTVENSVAVSRFSLRYFLQLNRLWRKKSSVDELDTLLGFFEKSTALGLYLDMDRAGTLTGAAIYNEKDPSFLISLGYEYRFTDQFKTKLSANVLTASGSNPIAAAYDKTDNVDVVVSYDF